jgi:radical SAM protein with 4Fe4S-binding SPASM domain
MSLTREYEFIIQWHLTERCNLKCKHCYQDGKKVKEMPLAAVSRVVDEAAAMIRDWQQAYEIEFSPSFNVTGGEPFLRADFFAILETMMAAGFACYVLSNGTLITLERAHVLADLGVAGVQVSLEGPESVHEAIRGPGSFGASLEGIQNLLAAGVPVSLNSTLSRFNASYFLDLVELAMDLGVPKIGFSRLVPTGQGLALLDRMLMAGQVEKLYEEIFALKMPGLEITTGDPLAVQMRQPAPEAEAEPIPAGGCAAGVAGLTILPDGTVTPCRRLPIPIGKAGKDSLREIWATSPVLERLRDKAGYQGKCGSCPRWSRCRGCRAIAYAYSQSQGKPDILAPDPQCFIPED